MVAKMLERPTLVLNRNWQPVNVATVARALVMLWNESARVVDPDDYRLYSWADWSALAAARGRAVHPGGSAAAAGAGGDRAGRLRPAAERRRGFSRRNMFKRDHYTCQYCGVPAGQRGAVDRPRHAAVARRHLDLGELRAGVRGVQQAQGRPHAAAGGHEAPQGSRSARRGSRCTPHEVRIESWSKFVSEAYWNVELEELSC